MSAAVAPPERQHVGGVTRFVFFWAAAPNVIGNASVSHDAFIKDLSLSPSLAPSLSSAPNQK